MPLKTNARLDRKFTCVSLNSGFVSCNYRLLITNTHTFASHPFRNCFHSRCTFRFTFTFISMWMVLKDTSKWIGKLRTTDQIAAPAEMSVCSQFSICNLASTYLQQSFNCKMESIDHCHNLHFKRMSRIIS